MLGNAMNHGAKVLLTFPNIQVKLLINEYKIEMICRCHDNGTESKWEVNH